MRAPILAHGLPIIRLRRDPNIRKPSEKGEIEGVAASESANNAVTGGALIPLLTLGIPGSGVTAIMLGGMMIKGLVPGHTLFTEQADITYAIILGFLVANILMGIIGLLIAKQVVKNQHSPDGNPYSDYCSAFYHWCLCHQQLNV